MDELNARVTFVIDMNEWPESRSRKHAANGRLWVVAAANRPGSFHL